MPSKEEFASLLSDLGLEMPEPPKLPTMEDTMATDIMTQYDTNSDGLLSNEELSLLSDEEFLALDADSDGSVSSEELSSAIEQVASSKLTAPAGGGNMNTSSEEEYDEADTNQDGIVSFEEKMAALGIDMSSENENSTQSQTASNEEMLETIKMLFETIKTNTTRKDENLDLSNFKNLMTMVNNQSNNSELNTYVSNLASFSTKFNYA